MNIRIISNSDVDALTILHKEIFGKSHFSSTFSKELLRKYFIELLKHHQFKLIATEDNKILGYLIAGSNPDLPVKKFLKQNYFRLLFTVLFNKTFIIEKLREIFSMLKSENQKDLHVGISVYLIAVKTDSQNAGVGRKLLKYFEELLIDKNIYCYTLAVRNENNSAIKFYHKNSFIEISRNHKTTSFKKELLKS